MQLSMHNWMRVEPIEVTIKRLARCGFHSIEISGEPAQYDVSHVKSLLDEHGLACWGSVTLMTGGRDLLHEDYYARYGSIKYAKDCIDLAAGLGGTVLTLIPSTVGKVVPMASPQDEWKWAVEGVREIAYHAGQKGVRVGIEPLNRFETDLVNTVEQGLDLCERIGLDNVGLLLDTFHLNIEEKSISDAIRAAGTKLFYFHACENDRGAPGSGHIEWDQVLPALGDAGFDGTVTIESFTPEIEEIARAVSMWRQVAPSADDLAQDGLAFLRRKTSARA